MHDSVILAAVASQNAGFSFDAGLGLIISNVFQVAGIFLVIAAVIMSAGKFLKGEAGKGVKTILIAALFSAFLFNPDLIISIPESLGGVVTGIVDLFQSTTN